MRFDQTYDLDSFVVPSGFDYAARLGEFNPLSTIFSIILIKTEFKRSSINIPKALHVTFVSNFWTISRDCKKGRSWMLCEIWFRSRFWTWFLCFFRQGRFYKFDEVCRLNARSKTRRKSGKCRILDFLSLHREASRIFSIFIRFSYFIFWKCFLKKYVKD